MSEDETNRTVERPSRAPLDEQRRDSLRRIGKLGAYTAPALLAVLISQKAPALTPG